MVQRKGKARGPGEGSIFKRCKSCRKATSEKVCPNCGGKAFRWVAQPPRWNGKTSKPIYGESREEVAAALTKVLAERQQGTYVEPSKMTVGQYLDYWIANVLPTKNVEPVTSAGYKRELRNNVIPVLGHVKLTKLGTEHIQELIANRLRAGKARRTVQYACTVFRAALQHAVYPMRALARNPFDGVNIPSPGKRNYVIVKPNELPRLLDAIRENKWFPLWYLDLQTAMRRAELLALRWRDIDWDNSCLYVQSSQQEYYEEAPDGTRRRARKFGEGKTASSRRRIDLPEAAIKVLRAHRAKQAEERLRMGAAYQDDDLVFAMEDGRPVYPSVISKAWIRLRDRAGFPGLRLHDLRHTHATLLLAAGHNPKVVQERLGHSDVKVTLGTYGHVLPTMQEEIKRTLDAVMPDADQKKDKRAQ